MTRNPGMVYLGASMTSDSAQGGGRPRSPPRDHPRPRRQRGSPVDGHSVVPVELRGVWPTAARSSTPGARSSSATIIPRSRPLSTSRCLCPLIGDDRREVYRDVSSSTVPTCKGSSPSKGAATPGSSRPSRPLPPLRSWVENPLRNQWLTDPLALDCAFQMMILWSVERTGSGSLPTFVGRYRQFRRAFPSRRRPGGRPDHRGQPASRPEPMSTSSMTRGQPVARIEDYECVIDASLKAAFRRNRAAQVESK